MTSAPTNNAGEKFLLPAGLGDGLPPEAGFEAAMVERLVASFARWGDERVKPPLIELKICCWPVPARRWPPTPSA